MDAQEIRRRRHNLELTQGELAERLSVRLETVSRWERGKETPKAPAMLRLALDELERQAAAVG